MNDTVKGTNLTGMCQSTMASFLNSTSCNVSNQTGFSEPPRNEHPFGNEIYIMVTTILFAAILAASLAGNSLVIFTILRRKRMKTPCNYFLMNIALADLGVGLIAAPLRILEIFASWPFGDFMCHFLWPIQDVFVCVSVLTHTTIGLERYRAIVMPFRPKISLRKTKIIIIILWLVCYCASGIPQSFLLELIDIMGWKYCFIQWPSLLFRRCYIMYLVLVFILVPLVVQTWCYLKIVSVLNRKREFGQSVRIVSRSNKEGESRKNKKKRLIRMLITSLVVFQVCYIPRGTLMIVLEFQPVDVINSQAFAYADLISLVLYYCKHIVNPVILFAMSADFRKAFVASVTECGGKTEQSLISLQQITTQDSLQEATV